MKLSRYEWVKITIFYLKPSDISVDLLQCTNTKGLGRDENNPSSVCFYLSVIFTYTIGSVRPIVQTSRTAFVCASDYDDRTQFHMFEQKNEHG